MDLLDDNNDVDLYNASEEMKIFSEDTKSVPQYVGKKAIVKNSLLNQGSVVLGHVEHSIISNEALIEEGRIEFNGGILENDVYDNHKLIQRYWIH